MKSKKNIEHLLVELELAEKRWDFWYASHLVQEIIKYYQKNNENKKASKELTLYKKKLREVTIKSQEQYSHFRQTLKIPITTIQRIVEDIKTSPTMNDAFWKRFLYFCVNHEQVIQYSKENVPLFVSISSISTTTAKWDINNSITNEQWLENSNYKSDLMRLTNMSGLVFKECLKQNIFNYKTISDFFINDGLFNSTSCLEKFKIWLIKFIEADYISSIHILITTFEEFLLDILNGFWVDIISFKKNWLTTWTSNLQMGMIMSDEVKAVLWNRLCKHIWFLLFDMNGFNLRNRVCHWEANIDEFNHTTCMSVLSLYLFIWAIVERKEI